MSRKGSQTLGKSLINRRANKNNRKLSEKHTTELKDGYDWGCLQSVTEQQQLDEFLLMAEASATEYAAEKNNITFVTPFSGGRLLSPEEEDRSSELQQEYRQCLQIPRKPSWDKNTTIQELKINEQNNFLEWRRQLAKVQEIEGIVLTPFEKNLEFWRQLWRVLERSDIVVQTVDARNPLLFRCEDLEAYVKELDTNKLNMILVNKADLLTHEQRHAWAEYFESVGLPVAFFSALQEINNTIKEGEELANDEPVSDNSICKNHCDILSRAELLDFIKSLCGSALELKDLLTIGLVGYPNVGKSSTINALLANKKVSVSATPGKTKHFQTILLENNICLCDCPGLVMPSFVATKADLIINGILSIDHVKDCIPPVTLIASRIPRHVLEQTYGIHLPPVKEDDDPECPPTAEQFLNAYGYMRGFMTQRGLPDISRSARYILKDYVQGKLLYSHAPPNKDQADFHTFPSATVSSETKPMLTPQELKINKMHITSRDLDKDFFKQNKVQAHMKGIQARSGSTKRVNELPSDAEGSAKPWKRHNNKNKKEKLRRIYSNLDQ